MLTDNLPNAPTTLSQQALARRRAAQTLGDTMAASQAEDQSTLNLVGSGIGGVVGGVIGGIYGGPMGAIQGAQAGAGAGGSTADLISGKGSATTALGGMMSGGMNVTDVASKGAAKDKVKLPSTTSSATPVGK